MTPTINNEKKQMKISHVLLKLIIQLPAMMSTLLLQYCRRQNSRSVGKGQTNFNLGPIAMPMTDMIIKQQL